MYAWRRWLYAWDWGRVWGEVERWVFCLLLALALTQATPPFGGERERVDRIAWGLEFDFAAWEADAIAVKLEQAWAGARPYLSDRRQEQIVRQYLDLMAQIQRLEGEIAAVYADPNVANPEAASAPRRAERDALRARQRTLQPLAETS